MMTANSLLHAGRHWRRWRTAIGWGALLAVGLESRAADEWLDRVEDALTFSGKDGQFRARFSGTLDLEGYAFQLPAPMLLRATGDALFVPRLTTFLDAQLGARTYLFAQARVDRGFDPNVNSLRPRLDEYALRLAPWSDGRLNLQFGKFATIVGNWALRHGSWANPFITAPLPYEYLTGMWDNEAVRTSTVLLQWSHLRPGLPASVKAIEKRFRLPLLWGPSYTIGAAAFGGAGRWQYALEVKQAAVSSRPRSWHHVDGYREHPTLSGRLGYRPSPTWDFGVSATGGTYLRPIAARTVAPGFGLGDYRQLMLGQDVAFAWRHLQVWTEIYAARFEIPTVGNADTVAYYAEAKYKLSPQFFAAARWNQQLFGRMWDRGVRTRWGHDVWRVDLAPGYRFTPHLQFKAQYSLQHGDSAGRDYTRTLAGQLTLRF